MFGHDIEEFLEYNVDLLTDITQDIYYCISEDKFWVEAYIGNMSHDYNFYKDNIWVYTIPPHMELDVICKCEYCDCFKECINKANNPIEDYFDGTNYYPRERIDRCTRKFIDNKLREYDYLNDKGIIQSIKDNIFVNVDDLLELETYFKEVYVGVGMFENIYEEQMEKYHTIMDGIIDDILDYGFKEDEDDYIWEHCYFLSEDIINFMIENEPSESTRNKLTLVTGLLTECRIEEALAVIKR